MTEIAERREQAEQQNRQGLLKDLFKTAREKAFPLKKEIVPTYEGELINGIFATDITIRKLHAKWIGGFMAEGAGYVHPLVQILPPKEKSSYKEFFSIYIKEFNMSLYVWKFREKGLVPKYTYNSSHTASGEGYQRFLNENHGDLIDFSSTENIKKLTNNIRRWKRV